MALGHRPRIGVEFARSTGQLTLGS